MSLFCISVCSYFYLCLISDVLSNFHLQQMRWYRVLFPDGGWLVLGLRREARVGASITVYVLELVNLAGPSIGGGPEGLACCRLHALSSRSHVPGRCLPREISIRPEVKRSVSVVMDSCHSALTQAVCALVPGASYLLPHAAGVSVLKLLKPKGKSQVIREWKLSI